MRRADGVGDAVGADFERIAIADLQTGLDSRLQDERIEPEVLAATAPQRVDDLRNDRTERDLLDAGRVAAVLPEHAAQEQSQLVGRRGRPRRLAETERQLAVRRKTPPKIWLLPTSSVRIMAGLQRHVVDEPHVAEAHRSQPAAVAILDVVDDEAAARCSSRHADVGGRRGRQGVGRTAAPSAGRQASRRWFRELSARPSGSRTVATGDDRRSAERTRRPCRGRG